MLHKISTIRHVCRTLDGVRKFLNLSTLLPSSGVPVSTLSRVESASIIEAKDEYRSIIGAPQGMPTGRNEVLPLREKHSCGLMTASRYISFPFVGDLNHAVHGLPVYSGFFFSAPKKRALLLPLFSKFHRIKDASPNKA